MTELRQVPLRVPPVEGESLDSWFRSYGHGIDAAPTDVIRHAGIEVTRRIAQPRRLAIGDDRAVVIALERSSGLESGSLRKLVDPLAAYVNNRRPMRYGQFAPLLKVMAWSRFCTQCLRETDGRWQATWRLGWAVVCAKHNLLLASRCPSCGGQQGKFAMAGNTPPPHPTLCPCPLPGRDKRARSRCGADLTAAGGAAAPAHLLQLTRHFLTRLADAKSDDDMRALYVDLHDYQVLASDERRRLGIESRLDIRGDGDTLIEVLDSASAAYLNPGGPEFRRIALAWGSGSMTGLIPVPDGWETVGPRLVEAAVAVRIAEARSVARLRWSGTGPGGTSTVGEIERHEAMKRLPAALWPAWTMAILPRSPISAHRYFRRAGLLAILLRGSTLRLPALCDSSAEVGISSETASRCFLQLSLDPGGHAAVALLERVTELWQKSAKPIDYERRRTIVVDSNVLDPEQWREMCGEAGVHPGESGRVLLAQRWLWEELTGGCWDQFPTPGFESAPWFQDAPLAASYVKFLRQLTPRLRELLRVHAVGVLNARGIVDEPLTWEPPMELDPGSHVPGILVGDANLTEVRELLLSDVPLQEIDQRLDIAYEHLMLLLRHGDMDLQREP